MKRIMLKLCGTILIVTALIVFIYLGLKVFFYNPIRQIYDNITIYGKGLKGCGMSILKLTVCFTLTFVVTSIASIAGFEMIAGADYES